MSIQVTAMSDQNDTCERCLFSRLLRPIVTHRPEALSELSQLRHGHGSITCGYWCYKAEDSAQCCACGFDLEYFDFIQDNSVNTEMLNVVCENIERGKCMHIVERERKNEDVEKYQVYISTTLLHAAAASGNATAAEYIVATDPPRMYVPSATGIMPFHLAVIKTQSGVLEYLHDPNDARAVKRNVLRNALKPAKRCMEVGCWRQPYFPNGVYECNIGHLLAMYNITDTGIVGKIVEMFHQLKSQHVKPDEMYYKTRLLTTLVNLIVNNSTQIAMMILTDERIDRDILVANVDQAKKLITACVLLDDAEILKALIGRDLNIQFYSNGYNVLDVAMAFGSKRCASILELYMKPTPQVYKEVSPYNFLMDAAYNLPTNTNYRDLMRKCSEQGFDVNGVDSKQCCSPLALAIERYPERFGRPLLEMGADVDCSYRGRSPILMSIEWHEPDFPRPEMVVYKDTGLLKYLLRYNPSTYLTKDALKRAVEYDLISTCMETIASGSPIKFKPDKTSGETDIYANTLGDRFLAVSAYAVLHELGFQTCESDIDYIHEETDFARIGAQEFGLPLYADKLSHCEMYRDYMLKIRQRPRSLKSSCRIAIRKAFAGRRLHAYISALNLPKILVNYVLCPYFLWATVVEGSISTKRVRYAANEDFKL